VIRRDLLTYLAAREAFSKAASEPQLAIAETRTETAQRRLWTDMVQGLTASPAAERGALDAADRMFNLAASRRAAIEAVVPATVLFGMVGYALIAAVLMGYSHSVDHRFLIASSVQFVLLALALGLIVDLDRPRTGPVAVNQAPLFRAAASIRSLEARRPAAAVIPGCCKASSPLPLASRAKPAFAPAGSKPAAKAYRVVIRPV
ncbi:MAG: hypothetical protein ACREEG_10185, partial [Phenylobacterium sp.]